MLATASTFCKPTDWGGWHSLQGLWLCHPFSMNYQIVKLDGRHAWSKIYRYTIEFPKGTYSSGVLEFDRARRWFNSTYGWSTDVKTQNEIAGHLNATRVPATQVPEDLNMAWAYCTEYRNYRIYVASDKELMFFELAHAGTA